MSGSCYMRLDIKVYIDKIAVVSHMDVAHVM